jgi:hypothetical protein
MEDLKGTCYANEIMNENRKDEVVFIYQKKKKKKKVTENFFFCLHKVYRFESADFDFLSDSRLIKSNFN